MPLLVLATGLAAHRRYLGAGVAGAAAFLIHPPTVYPFWAVYACYAIWPQPAEACHRLRSPAGGRGHSLRRGARCRRARARRRLSSPRVTPLMEKLQRWRAPYVWISIWWKDLLPQYLLLCALAVAAYLRLRRQMTPELRFFQLGLPVVGMLSMPLSWLLLEQWKWALMPQFQPLRALLFVTLCAIFGAACAGCAAVKAAAVYRSIRVVRGGVPGAGEYAASHRFRTGGARRRGPVAGGGWRASSLRLGRSRPWRPPRWRHSS